LTNAQINSESQENQSQDVFDPNESQQNRLPPRTNTDGLVPNYINYLGFPCGKKILYPPANKGGVLEIFPSPGLIPRSRLSASVGSSKSLVFMRLPIMGLWIIALLFSY